MEKDILSQKLKNYRNRTGLTQEQFASQIGITRSAYAYYEIGKTKPKLSILKKIAQFYDLSVDDFLEDNNDVYDLAQREPELVPEWDIDDTFNQLTNFEKSVICKVRKMSMHEKEALSRYLNK